MVRGDKSGQMKLSFGMIFSIILIVAFVTFAVYAIITFLGVQETAKVAIFRDNLQEDINKIWRVQYGIQEVSYSLPGKIEEVCFKDSRYENIFFKPNDVIPSLAPKEMKYIDLNAMLAEEDPFCLEVKNKKVRMILKKSRGETLVTIEKPGN